MTAFQNKVYESLQLVPKGKVTTYKLLAMHIDCGSCQAVGQALRRNPFAPRVPCHRVIASDLTIGGFAGNRTGPEIKRKLALLKSEGVHFKDGHLIDPSKIFRFSGTDSDFLIPSEKTR